MRSGLARGLEHRSLDRLGRRLAGPDNVLECRVEPLALRDRGANQILDLIVGYLAPNLQNAVYSDLLTYTSYGITWTGSDSQLQTRGAGLVHLILSTAEYQFV